MGKNDIVLRRYGDDEFENNRKKYRARSNLAPFAFSRISICGESGCGKTSLLLNLLLTENLKCKYNRVWICIPDFSEHKYKTLIEYYENLIQSMVDDEKITQEQADNMERPYKFISSPNDLPELNEEFKQNNPGHSYIIFDDCIALSKKDQQKIAEYYIKSRKYGISCVYLTQSFYDLELLIRKNTNVFILFTEGQNTTRNQIANTVGMTEACKDCYKNLRKFSFVVINREQDGKKRELVDFKPIKKIRDYF